MHAQTSFSNTNGTMLACFISALLAAVTSAPQPTPVLPTGYTTGILTVGPCIPHQLQNNSSHDLACESIQHQLRTDSCWGAYTDVDVQPFPISQVTYLAIPMGNSLKQICTNCSFLRNSCVDVSCHRSELPWSIPAAFCTVGQLDYWVPPENSHAFLIDNVALRDGEHFEGLLIAAQATLYIFLAGIAGFAMYAAVGTGILVCTLISAWAVITMWAFQYCQPIQPTTPINTQEQTRHTTTHPQCAQPSVNTPHTGQTIVTNVAVNVHLSNLSTHAALAQVLPHVGALGHAARVSPVEKQELGPASVLSHIPKSVKKNVDSEKSGDDPQPLSVANAAATIDNIDGIMPEVESEAAFQHEMEALFPFKLPTPVACSTHLSGPQVIARNASGFVVGNNPLYRGTNTPANVVIHSLSCIDEEEDTSFRLHSLQWGNIQQKPTTTRKRKALHRKPPRAAPNNGMEGHSLTNNANAHSEQMLKAACPPEMREMALEVIGTQSLEKFTKMITMGVPAAAVHFKMRQEGLDPSALEGVLVAPVAPVAPVAHPAAGVMNAPSGQLGLQRVDAAPDGKLVKYERMLVLGIPLGAVLHKMRTEGVAEQLINSFHATGSPASSPSKTCFTAYEKEPRVPHTPPPAITMPANRRLVPAAIDLAQLKAQFTQPKESSFLISAAVKPAAIIHTTSATVMLPMSAGPLPLTGKAFSSRKVSLLDQKRSTNAGIALAKLKISGDHAAQMLLTLTCRISVDTKTIELCASQVQLLMEQLLPTPSELKEVGNYLEKHPDGLTSLGEVEKFLFSLRNVDNLLLRAQLLVDRCSLDSILGELAQKCLLLQHALTLISSETIQEVISQSRHILAAFHEGRFSAEHASLEKLAVLSTTKSSDNKSTLMHFLASHLADKHPTLLQEVRDITLKALISCKGMKLNDIRNEISTVTTMESRLHKSASLQPPTSPLAESALAACRAEDQDGAFATFRQKAGRLLSESKLTATKTLDAYTTVRLELREPDKCNPDDMLMSVLKLLEGLRTAASDNARKALVKPTAPPVAADWRSELAAKMARRVP